MIPHEQRDLNTAGTLVDKLLLNGIEVHQATRPFSVNGREYKNAWVVLMDQPFSPSGEGTVRKAGVAGPAHHAEWSAERPYDVAGWTLPCRWAWRSRRCCCR